MLKSVIFTAALVFQGFFNPAQATIMVSPPSLDFGGVPVGQASTQRFWIRNYGSETVRIFQCFVPGVYRCSLNCYGILTPGQECSGFMNFYPQTHDYEVETAVIETSEFPVSLIVRGFGI